MLGQAADVVLPPLCPGCHKPVAAHHGLCAQCWSELRFLTPPLCPVHGTPLPAGLGEDAVSAEAIANPPPFSRARAAVAYDRRAARIVSGFKYADRGDYAPIMARLMAHAGKGLLADAQLVVPVPLHWGRFAGRRFNQSADLARRLCRERLGAYAPDILVRRKATRSQVGLEPAQRALNVAGAFAVQPEQKPRLAGRRVLLIDDVFTTGATVDAATRVLKRAGALHVDVLTFARVLKGD